MRALIKFQSEQDSFMEVLEPVLRDVLPKVLAEDSAAYRWIDRNGSDVGTRRSVDGEL